MISFDDLPNDIKIKIFSIHEENNYKIEKDKFDKVLNELQNVFEFMDRFNYDILINCINILNLNNLSFIT